MWSQQMLRAFCLLLLSGVFVLQPTLGCSEPAKGGETKSEPSKLDAGGDVESVASDRRKDGGTTDLGNPDVGRPKDTSPDRWSEPRFEARAEAQQEPRQDAKVEPANESVVDAGASEPAGPESQEPSSLPEKSVEPLPEKAPKDTVPPKSCAKDVDCGRRTCAQVGKICKRNTPICRAGKCVNLNVDVVDTTCDTKTGVCRAPKPRCQEACDCAQGLMCVKDAKGDGTCIAGFVPVYCCANQGCPSGKACVQRGGGKGTCP